jgi:hypothetical protein
LHKKSSTRQFESKLSLRSFAFFLPKGLEIRTKIKIDKDENCFDRLRKDGTHDRGDRPAAWPRNRL